MAVVLLFPYSRRIGMEVDPSGQIYRTSGRGAGAAPAGSVDPASGVVARRGRAGRPAPCGEVDAEGVVYLWERRGIWPWARRHEPLPVLEIGGDGEIYDLSVVNRRPQVGAVEGAIAPRLAGGAALLLWLLYRRERTHGNPVFWQHVATSQRGQR